MLMTLRRILALTVACILLTGPVCSVRAEELRYYMGDVPLNAAKDSGYTGTDPIDSDDPHFGWSLGRFYVTGYTQGPDSMSAGDPVFLKNAGDTVALWFRLDQQIDCLNGDSELSIARDEKGWDVQFGIPKTDFGRGTLIIRHTDHQNQPGEPVIYTDYLSALETGAEVRVELFEEGDYEVALDYSIHQTRLNVFDYDVFPRVEDYRIFFRFSVRNGNCMVFPFDTATGAELSNASSTPNGFYLDLARSRYLDIQVRRTVMTQTAEGFVEDVRFNRPARDGEQYNEEGIYTITVRNRYTGQDTVKTIYVGTDEALRAHAATGLPMEEITRQLSAGAVVNEDGTLTSAEEQTEIPEELLIWIGAGAAVAALVGVVVLLLLRRRRRSLLDYDGRRWWG